MYKRFTKSLWITNWWVGYSFRPQIAYENPTWFWHKHVTFHNIQLFTKITELIKLQLNYDVN